MQKIEEPENFETADNSKYLKSIIKWIIYGIIIIAIIIFKEAAKNKLEIIQLKKLNKHININESNN